MILPNLIFAIENCDISGKIQDANSGNGISNAKIDLYSESNTFLKSIVSKNDGTFCFESINSGKYFIYVKANGYQSIKKYAVSKTLVETASLILKMKKEITNEVMSEMNISNDYIAPTNYSKKIRTSAYNYYPTGGAHYSFNSLVIHNTESYDKINDNEFKSVAKDPLSTFSIDVDRAAYSNVRRFINNGTLPEPNAVRIEEMINYFSYDYPSPKGNDPFSITSEYTDCPWNDKHKLVHVGIKGKEIEMDNVPPYNLVFLIDVSGSMNSPNRLPLLKSALGLLVDQMREQDKVSIVVYAGAAGVVLPPTSGANKSQIFDALDNLSAGGSTAGGAGIELAYKVAKENFIKKGNNRVILAFSKYASTHQTSLESVSSSHHLAVFNLFFSVL
jgi:Ca-activated chloride channel family protein